MNSIGLTNFKLVWLPFAYKQLNKCSHTDQKKLLAKIELIIGDFERLDIKKLKGHSDLYRVRCGNYRIIYKVIKKEQQVLITSIAHRKDVYKLLTAFSSLLQLYTNFQ